MVGPVKYKKPIPFSGVPEKIGNPIIPSNKYKETVAKPNFQPNQYLSSKSRLKSALSLALSG